MRVLHSAALLSPSQGMLNQMKWEQEAATQLGIPWKARMYCPKDWEGPENILIHSSSVHHKVDKSKLGKAIDWLALRYRYHQWLLSLEDQYDVFVLRYYVHDPFQLYFLKRIKKPVFLVHHALEVIELAIPGRITDRIRSQLESVIGPHSLSYASGLIGVTREILDDEVIRTRKKSIKQKYLIYPNGITYSDKPLEDKRGTKIELLFVSTFFTPWQGLDLLIESLKASSNNFILHIVGETTEADLQYLITDQRILLHGKLSHNEIISLSARCHCGLSSFALFRQGMKDACSLKVREYLMSGLPVYAGHEDVFPDNFNYYKKGEANISDILEYAIHVAGTSKSEISYSARKYIDKKLLLENLYREITSKNDNFTNNS